MGTVNVFTYYLTYSWVIFKLWIHAYRSAINGWSKPQKVKLFQHQIFSTIQMISRSCVHVQMLIEIGVTLVLCLSFCGNIKWVVSRLPDEWISLECTRQHMATCFDSSSVLQIGIIQVGWMEISFLKRAFINLSRVLVHVSNRSRLARS